MSSNKDVPLCKILAVIASKQNVFNIIKILFSRYLQL